MKDQCCLPWDALIHTSNGLTFIEDVQIGDLVQTPLGFRKVTNKFDQDVQDVYTINTNATPLRSTLNHWHAVLDEDKGEVLWKQASDLVLGDRLVHNTQVLFGTVTYLPFDFTGDRLIKDEKVDHLTIPALTAKTAWLIGFTHGNAAQTYIFGSNDGEGGVEWTINRLNFMFVTGVLEKLREALDLFGVTAANKIFHDGSFSRVCSSIRFAEYFEQYVKKPDQPLWIPGFIRQGTSAVRAAYLAGLIDSSRAADNFSLHAIATTDYPFIRQVGAVVSSLGIASQISFDRPKKDDSQTRYKLEILSPKSRYNTLIAPHSANGLLDAKNEVKYQAWKSYKFTVIAPVYTVDVCGVKQKAYSYNQDHYVVESDIGLGVPITMQSLGDSDPVWTYDIEVEEVNCFYCNGYLTR